MHNYKQLEVWNKGVQLATDIYKLTKEFPKEEKYGIISQMRRCSVSISSNIAEGAGRHSDKEFRQFLNISFG
ncbi:MAG: four helix bundle protein, partial [Gracilimonas sp.]|nr:four helix bundle protein [Gracilimonas sp.]